MAKSNVPVPDMFKDLRVLIFDIETMDTIAGVWGMWNQNVGLRQVYEDGYILCWCAKWVGEEDVYYHSVENPEDTVDMLESIKELILEADLVVGHNGDKFDLRWLRTEMLKHGVEPFPGPSHLRSVDTLKVVKQLFRFKSNRLDNVANELGCKPKSGHANFPGYELWRGVREKADGVWDEMIEYCAQDVDTLEEVFLKLLPWIKLPVGLTHKKHGDGTPTCRCGSTNLQKRGTVATAASVFQRYRCNDCGTWSRGRVNQLPKTARQSLTI